MVENTTITFEDMPRALAYLIQKIEELEHKLDGLGATPSQKDTWMDIKELCDYLPMRPATQTVYGWTSAHMIPFHKKGKRIVFLKSEIDKWMVGEQLKSIKEIEADAEAFCNRKKGGKG